MEMKETRIPRVRGVRAVERNGNNTQKFKDLFSKIVEHKTLTRAFDNIAAKSVVLLKSDGTV